MTKGTWTVIIAVVLMLAIGAGVAYRAPLRALIGSLGQGSPQSAEQGGAAAQWQTFSTSTFAISYPSGYALNAAYAYDQFGPKKLIHGVSFTVPAAMSAGTNLSSDTRISVEQLPRAKKCTGDIFIPADVKAHVITEGGIEYSTASTSGVGAGNFYEEQVFALATSSPCTAVRYLVHSGNISTYEPGAVSEFNRTALLADFDKIRRSLVAR